MPSRGKSRRGPAFGRRAIRKRTVVAGGLLLVNSGYPRFGGAAGNVLLAFEPDPQAP